MTAGELATTPQLDQDQVIETALELWSMAGEACEAQPWLQFAAGNGLTQEECIHAVVMIPRLNRLECLLNTQETMTSALDDIRTLVAKGWDVNALLPVQFLGSAHEAFRGLPIKLQGYWTRSGSGLKFSSPEVP